MRQLSLVQFLTHQGMNSHWFSYTRCQRNKDEWGTTPNLKQFNVVLVGEINTEIDKLQCNIINNETDDGDN